MRPTLKFKIANQLGHSLIPITWTGNTEPLEYNDQKTVHMPIGEDFYIWLVLGEKNEVPKNIKFEIGFKELSEGGAKNNYSARVKRSYEIHGKEAKETLVWALGCEMIPSPTPGKDLPPRPDVNVTVSDPPEYEGE